jgi:hypothetical protein
MGLALALLVLLVTLVAPAGERPLKLQAAQEQRPERTRVSIASRSIDAGGASSSLGLTTARLALATASVKGSPDSSTLGDGAVVLTG